MTRARVLLFLVLVAVLAWAAWCVLHLALPLVTP
jgi:hypothetical protein